MLHIENLLFIRWVLKWHIIETIVFYLSKVSKKIHFKIYGKVSVKYPDRIRRYLIKKNQLQCRCHVNMALDGLYSGEIIFTSINLAGSTLCVDNGIEWEKDFDDSEDYESLHRWNWIIDKLSSTPQNKKKVLIRWVQSQQEDWIDKFQNDIKKNNTIKKLKWESYTVGERIANTVIFYHLTLGGFPSVKISNSIKFQVGYLVNNLEYFGKYTGNHVVNNARAVYLAGVIYDCEWWKILAFKIIERELPIIVTEDGFMREGSSHYQFLFTRWLLEVYYFAVVADDEKMMELLSAFLKLLVEQCYFFLVENKKSGIFEIPLFGDVSPDFPPRWLQFLPWSKLATCFVEFPQKRLGGNASSWNLLWDEVNFLDNNRKNRKSVISSNSGVSNVYPKSGWFRIEYREFTLFYRMDRDNSPSYVGHHHHDIYHFCLYQNGVPIFVDSGRKNYDQSSNSWGMFGVYPQAHNSVTVDGVGCLPEKPGRYPIKYLSSKNITEIENSSRGVSITIKSACFQRLYPPVTLIRKIILNSNGVQIEDEFIGEGVHSIMTYFHFSSGIFLQKSNKYCWKLKSNRIDDEFKVNYQGESKIVHYKGGDSYHGWSVPAYGKLEKASTLLIDYRCKLPITLRYSLILGKE